MAHLCLWTDIIRARNGCFHASAAHPVNVWSHQAADRPPNAWLAGQGVSRKHHSAMAWLQELAQPSLGSIQVFERSTLRDALHCSQDDKVSSHQLYVQPYSSECSASYQPPKSNESCRCVESPAALLSTIPLSRCPRVSFQGPVTEGHSAPGPPVLGQTGCPAGIPPSCAQLLPE